MFSALKTAMISGCPSLRVTIFYAFTFAPCLWHSPRCRIAQPTVDRGTASLPNEPQPPSSNETVTPAMVRQPASPGRASVVGTAIAENGSPLSGATRFPDTAEAPKVYAKRFGTRYADTFSSRLIGSAIRWRPESAAPESWGQQHFPPDVY